MSPVIAHKMHNAFKKTDVLVDVVGDVRSSLATILYVVTQKYYTL